MARVGILAAALLALLAPVSVAGPQIAAGPYRLDSGHTRVLFALSRFGLVTYRGEFAGASGALVFDPAAAAASRLDVSVPTTGVIMARRDLERWLEGPAWFDAARFPVMTFRSTAVAATGADTANVTGALTLHGVTRPLTLRVRFTPAGSDRGAGFEATGRIRRSDFGIGRYAFLIGDTVELTINAAFERARS
jgi:polyisoprenoid-binding protein YceI